MEALSPLKAGHRHFGLWSEMAVDRDPVSRAPQRALNGHDVLP
jgi:hypothetical protein